MLAVVSTVTNLRFLQNTSSGTSSCCRNPVHSALINCTKTIHYTATELRKQLQDSARYEIRVSISQPPIFCFHFSALSFATSFLPVSIPHCSVASAAAHFVSGPLRFQFSSRSATVICLQSEQYSLFVARISVTRSLAQPCTASHSRAQC